MMLRAEGKSKRQRRKWGIKIGNHMRYLFETINIFYHPFEAVENDPKLIQQFFL